MPSPLNFDYPYQSDSFVDNTYNWDRFEEINRDINSLWITPSEAKNAINLFTDDSQDDLISRYTLSARLFIEEYLGRAIFERTFISYYSKSLISTSGLIINIPNGRVDTTIVSVNYYDKTDPNPILVTYPTQSYFYDKSGFNVVMQNIDGNIINDYYVSPITCEFQVEADPIASYPNVKQAGLLLIGHFYNHRSNTQDKSIRAIEYGLEALLSPYKDLVL